MVLAGGSGVRVMISHSVVWVRNQSSFASKLVVSSYRYLPCVTCGASCCCMFFTVQPNIATGYPTPCILLRATHVAGLQQDDQAAGPC